jgi:hypothetical protein
VLFDFMQNGCMPSSFRITHSLESSWMQCDLKRIHACWVVLFRVTLQRLGHFSSSLSFPVLLIHCLIWNLSVYHVISESWSNPGNCQETHFDQIHVMVNKPILLHRSWKWEMPRLEFSLWQRRWTCLIFVPPLLLSLKHCSNDSMPTEK